MSDNYNEFGEETESSKKRRYISYGALLVVLVVLGFLIFYGQNAEREVSTDSEAQLEGYEEIDEYSDAVDETLNDYIQNIRHEIEYVFTAEIPDLSYLTEEVVAKKCSELRNQLGRQVYCSESVGYRDRALCSDGESCIVLRVRLEDAKAQQHAYEFRFNPSRRTGENGCLDYYTSFLMLEEIEE